MIKLSFFLLLLTLPLLGGSPLFGIPMWVFGSLAATIAYGIAVIAVIETRWDRLKDEHEQ